MRIALAILISILAIAAKADGIHKWVDDKGVVHFGSQPPQKEEVEVVRKPKSDRLKQWEAEQKALEAEKQLAVGAPEEKAAETKSAANKKEEQPQQVAELSKAEQAVRAQRCRMAQSNLQELSAHARVREIGQDGKMRVLPEEERQARMAKAQQAINENC